MKRGEKQEKSKTEWKKERKKERNKQNEKGAYKKKTAQQGDTKTIQHNKTENDSNTK